MWLGEFFGRSVPLGVRGVSGIEAPVEDVMERVLCSCGRQSSFCTWSGGVKWIPGPIRVCLAVGKSKHSLAFGLSPGKDPSHSTGICRQHQCPGEVSGLVEAYEMLLHALCAFQGEYSGQDGVVIVTTKGGRLRLRMPQPPVA